MKYAGRISDPKDLITKEYADNLHIALTNAEIEEIWYPSPNNYLCFQNTDTSSIDIGFNINGTLTIIPTVQYRINDGSWIDYTFGDSVSLDIDDKCYWRAKGTNNSWSESGFGYIKFASSGNVEASGNIMTLLDRTGNSLVIPCVYCFYMLFYGCTTLNIKDGEVNFLPATTITDYCYYGMFSMCSALTYAPPLRATVLASHCYASMYYDCSLLNFVPTDALPATTLEENCYALMFYGCSALTTAPELHATTLKPGCYAYMFCGCSSLIIPPTLSSATTLGAECCSGMFKDCTSLTTLVKLSTITMVLQSYSYMFSGCSNIKVSETQDATYQYEWRLPTTGTGTEAYWWNQNMLVNTGGTFTGNPTINTVYYTDHEPI